MKKFLVKVLESFLDKKGYQIKIKEPILTPKEIESIELKNFVLNSKWLRDYNFNTIIDIGANEGQFAKKMRNCFPDARILSFEPIESVFNTLNDNFKSDKNFKAYNLALGDEQGETEINLNEYSPSSSLLDMGNVHKENFDFAVIEKKIPIKVDLLDSILSSSDVTCPILTKIDVQGFEPNVIKGGRNIIAMSDVVILEVSFRELYHGQELFDSLYTTMKSMGFTYCGNFEQLYSPETNEILQADAIFKRIHK